MDMLFSTIAGGLFALLGVLVTLRHEREKAEKERKFAAKHKALQFAAEAVTKFLNYYMTFPDRDLPKDGTTPSEVTDMSVALNSLHFYCDIETIERSMAMGQILSTAFANALKAKIPAIFISEDIKVIDIQIAGLETINNRLQQEVLAILTGNQPNSLLIDQRRFIADNFNKMAELQNKKTDLIKNRYFAIEACRDVITRDLNEVYGALRKVLLMARRELEFEIDENRYTKMLDAVTENALVDLNSLYSEIRTEVKKRIQ